MSALEKTVYQRLIIARHPKVSAENKTSKHDQTRTATAAAEQKQPSRHFHPSHVFAQEFWISFVFDLFVVSPV